MTAATGGKQMAKQEGAARFTPGPWKVRKEWHGDGKEIYPAIKVSIGEPSAICVVDGIYDECAANARLIAAAPELLESLRAVMVWIDSYSPEFTQDPEWKDCEAAVNAAIAKALGSAQ